MDDLDKQLLNTLQMNLPLTPRPYAAMGAELGLSETAVIARVAELKRQNILRQVSAIFDTRKIGYRSSLVAAQVPPERLTQAARVVNEHPASATTTSATIPSISGTPSPSRRPAPSRSTSTCCTASRARPLRAS